MEMIKCYEGHLFCMDCLRRYAEEKVFGNGDLGKKGCTELCCMDMSGCQSFFSREQLLKSLSEKVMKRYDELQTTLVLEKAGLVDDICKCPKCDFQASLPESQNVLQCPACGFESCRKCGEESHIPLRCEEVERKTETSARLQIEEAMTEARIRHCPRGCKQGFYKVEGCNKMTCPTCKTWICYVCRSAIEKVRRIRLTQSLTTSIIAICCSSHVFEHAQDRRFNILCIFFCSKISYCMFNELSFPIFQHRIHRTLVISISVKHRTVNTNAAIPVLSIQTQKKMMLAHQEKPV